MKRLKKIDIHVHSNKTPGIPRNAAGDTFATPEELFAMYDQIGVEKGLRNSSNAKRQIERLIQNGFPIKANLIELIDFLSCQGTVPNHQLVNIAHKRIGRKTGPVLAEIPIEIVEVAEMAEPLSHEGECAVRITQIETCVPVMVECDRREIPTAVRLVDEAVNVVMVNTVSQTEIEIVIFVGNNIPLEQNSRLRVVP